MKPNSIPAGPNVSQLLHSQRRLALSSGGLTAMLKQHLVMESSGNLDKVMIVPWVDALTCCM
jgi:hypothetical protein